MSSVPPVVNTHVHVPPNFSAFSTLAELFAAARDEGVCAIGVSNFYDQRIYRRFNELAKESAVFPIFGLEFITIDAELAKSGVRVNDPANPGRIYLCGKGIDPFLEKSPIATGIAAAIRTGNDDRGHATVRKLCAHLRQVGLNWEITAEQIASDLAATAEVSVEWVSLQERHIAAALYQALQRLPHNEQPGALRQLYGEDPIASPSASVDTQDEIRSRLLKAGTPGYVPEVPLDFAEAYRYILELKGIVTFPILADGAGQLSEFEWPVATLAANLKNRGVFLAELIPSRNAGDIVDEYVAGLTEAGILVLAGTEHNTPDRVGLQPRCRDRELSDFARKKCYEATCVVAAHQERIRRGQPGLVDETGQLIGNIAELTAEGDQLMRQCGMVEK